MFLKDALLCLSCEYLYDSREVREIPQRCPKCDLTMSWPIERWIKKRLPIDQEIFHEVRLIGRGAGARTRLQTRVVFEDRSLTNGNE